MQRRFPRRIDALADVFEYTRSFYATHAIAPGDALPIDFAIEELFTNLVRYQPPECGDIDVVLEREGNVVGVRISGRESPRYDPTSTPPVDIGASLDQRQPGGLGVHLTRKLVDRFSYRFDAGVGETSFVRTLRGDAGV
jgi:anti-sigma regulatory factor (Ser/Thr protein kinase)